jgi:hypothetical protein
MFGRELLSRPNLFIERFGFCCRLPCPILSAFSCGKGGIPNTISVYTISTNALARIIREL